MIGSVLIKFQTQSEIEVLGSGEESLRDLVLAVLRKSDKSLVKEIQDSQGEMAFTVSPILKGARTSRGHSFLLPDLKTSFRITYLKEEIFESLIKGLLFFLNKKETLKFSGGEILLERVDWQQGEKASFTCFEEISSQAQDDRRIILEFCSPTTFANAEESLFPLPEHVFSSLLKKWNAFSEVKIPTRVQGEFKKIRVSQHRLKTEIVPFSEGQIIGFMGKATYELPETIDEKTREAVNALADFAFYSCIGDKTDRGLGQARRLKNPDPEKFKPRG
ncbi:MAG: CRISPR-associated endoribonuclease Cas6 [Candidatus Aminicenantes bacterium]|nr:CRISPR-associated endoribonuclease Cas6 [Candidatus Aminicenantes bacterium]